jgi:hypothetical protein
LRTASASKSPFAWDARPSQNAGQSRKYMA